jgi:MinD-like ATPase involved in chromosome partitioning or flagellar assembly
MYAKVICFVSGKGGTGKTTTAASLAKLLATLEKQVLLIDMDAATNGLSLLFLDKLVLQKQASNEKYIFCWDELPGRDEEILIEFLTENAGMEWARTAKIEKIDNGKTIKIYTDKNSLSLVLDDKEIEVIQDIDGIITDKFTAKKENGKLNIYKEKDMRGLFEATEAKPPVTFTIDTLMDFLPAVYEMKQIECLVDGSQFEKMFFKVIKEFISIYDYIIIDTQAGTEAYTKIAIDVADAVVIVSEFDPISLGGVERFKRLFADVLLPEKTWILINKILPEFTKSIKGILKIAKFLDPIPWDADVVRALASRKLALDTEKGNAYTLAIMQVASSLLGDEISEDIQRWKKEKENRFKEPIIDQLAEIESQIRLLEEEQIETNLKLRRFNLLRTYSVIMIPLMAVAAIYFIFFNVIYINDFTIALLFLLLGAISVLAISITIFDNKIHLPNIFKGKNNEKSLQEKSLYLTRKINELLDDQRKYRILSKYDFDEYLENKPMGPKF